eukprot:86196_1
MLCSPIGGQSNMNVSLAVAESIALLSEVTRTIKEVYRSANLSILYRIFGVALKAAQSSPQHQTPLTCGICSVLHVMHKNDLATSGTIDDIAKELESAMNVLHPLCAKQINFE